MRATFVTTVTALLLVSLVAPAIGAAAAANDSKEPNDDFATATPIDPGTYGSLSVDGEEMDFYAVELTAGQTLDASIEHAEDIPTDVDVNLHDPDGDRVSLDDEFSTPASSTVTVRATTQAEQTGTYYVVVSGGEEDSQIPYSLSVAVAANDRFESNGNFDGATPLKPGSYGNLTMLSGEWDNYAVALSEGETLNATLTRAADAEIEPSLTIYGPDGDRIQFDREYSSPTSGTVAHRATIQAEQAGTYYVRVSGNDDYQGPSDYALSVAVAANDRFEPNGNFDGASPLESGTYRNLSILSGEQDYYAVELTAGEPLNATLTRDESTALDPSLDIYAPDGDRIQYGEEYTSPTSSAIVTRATAQAAQTGTYYVMVSGDGDYQGTSPYSLSVAVAANDRFESNGNFDSATPLGPGTYGNLSILSDERDYYAVDLSAGDTLNTTVVYGGSAQISPSLNIHGPDGDRIQHGEASSEPTSSNVTEQAAVEVERDGTYYVEVSGSSEYQGASPYSLLIDAPEQSTPTATDTPTATRTASETTTQTATETEGATTRPETETDTAVPETTDAGAATTVTSQDGPGMGIVVALIGSLAGGSLAARRSVSE